MLAAMLVFSSVTPTPDENLASLSARLPLPVIEGSHFLASLLGLVLIIVARGLAQRLDGAWWAALAFRSPPSCYRSPRRWPSSRRACSASSSSACLSAAHVQPAGHDDQRHPDGAVALGHGRSLCLFALAVLLFVYRDVEYSHDLWWQFEFSAEAPRGLRAVLGLVIFAGAFSTWSLMRPARGAIAAPTAADMDRAMAIVARQGLSDANLVKMGDKSLMFSDEGDAFIMYGRQGRSWIASVRSGRPREAWAELIWRFVESARAAGCRPVFYQVSPAGLSFYADAGLRAFRLGEIASIDLEQFTLKGGKWATLRQTQSRGLRDGLVFELIEPEGVPAILDELQQVSDGWLAHHEAKEKGFSPSASSPPITCCASPSASCASKVASSPSPMCW